MREFLSILIVAALSLNAIAQNCYTDARGRLICPPGAVATSIVQYDLTPAVDSSPPRCPNCGRPSEVTVTVEPYGPQPTIIFGADGQLRAEAGGNQNSSLAVHCRNDHGIDTRGMSDAQMQAAHKRAHAGQTRSYVRSSGRLFPRLFGRWR